MDRKEAASRAFKMSFMDARNRVHNAVLLAGAVMLLSLPMFYYQYAHMMRPVFAHAPTLKQLKLLALGQSIILFAPALVCSLVGFLYYERLGLPGPGRLGELKRWVPLSLLLGLALIVPSYYLTDRHMLAVFPEAYPRPWAWALAWAAGNSLSQEVVARFGLLSIGVYLLRWRGHKGHPAAAIAVVSLFAAVCSLLFFQRLGLSGLIEPRRALASLALVFGVQWVLCEVYVRKGLAASLCLHLGLSARLVVYCFIR
ncbi:MAG TPA: hypothetical protein VM658_17555 [bacterium]|nr:hypothetical protein [bacterium]